MSLFLGISWRKYIMFMIYAFSFSHKGESYICRVHSYIKEKMHTPEISYTTSISWGCVLLLSLSHDWLYLIVEYFSIESIFTYSAKWGSWAKFDIPSPHKNLSHCLNISYYWKLKNENTKKSYSCSKKVLVSPVNSTQNPLKKCVN